MKFFQVLILALTFSSCNNSSSSDLVQMVKSSMIEKWEQEGIHGITIQNLTLNLVDDNSYSGTLETIEEGEYFSYPVKVVVSGDEFEWEIIGQENNSQNNIQENETNTICSVCGNSFKGNGYEEQIDGSWEELSNDYQGTICSPTCGRKNNEKLNDAVRGYEESNSTNNSDYGMGNDGRVYEKNACGLCKGTGIETGRNIATGEQEGRICPMCDGKGVRSY